MANFIQQNLPFSVQQEWYLSKILLLPMLLHNHGIYFKYHDICSIKYAYVYVCNTFTPQIKGNSRGCHVNHKETSQCTFSYILGKWLHFKIASHFHQSKESLDVDEDPPLILCKYILMKCY